MDDSGDSYSVYFFSIFPLIDLYIIGTISALDSGKGCNTCTD